jgi:lipopolysaccharide/colanic/teichoic acid biosynthesis glycosyltransferase
MGPVGGTVSTVGREDWPEPSEKDAPAADVVGPALRAVAAVREAAATGSGTRDEVAGSGTLGAVGATDATPIVVDLTSGTASVTLGDAHSSPDIDPGRIVGPLQGLLGASPLRLGVKRAIDMVLALVALIVFAPILLVVAVLVATTSRGPVFYKSVRLGRGGEPFSFWKFRTMYNGADRDLESYLHMNDQSGPVFKIKDDPRRTRVGSFLRRSSIDELPQLLHVLSGKMSIVGPRPPLPGEVLKYGVVARQRLLVKPGLTCIWQVSGRSNVDFDTWVQMDLDYIATWSLGSDIKLILRTIPAVLRGTGAH